MSVAKKYKDDLHSLSLFSDCESAFQLIQEGKEKQAEEMFPLEFYLIQKYFYVDLKDLSALLEKKLTIND